MKLSCLGWFKEGIEVTGRCGIVAGCITNEFEAVPVGTVMMDKRSFVREPVVTM